MEYSVTQVVEAMAQQGHSVQYVDVRGFVKVLEAYGMAQASGKVSTGKRGRQTQLYTFNANALKLMNLGEVVNA